MQLWLKKERGKCFSPPRSFYWTSLVLEKQKVGQIDPWKSLITCLEEWSVRDGWLSANSLYDHCLKTLNGPYCNLQSPLLYISTSVWVLGTPNTGRNSHFQQKSLLLWAIFDLYFFAEKTLKMTISTSVWRVQHPNADQNIQQSFDYENKYYL